MAELKTKINNNSVDAFIKTVGDAEKMADSHALVKLLKQVTKQEPYMWGSSIIGFGSYHYKYASGHEGDAPIVGFSPRKQKFSLYLMGGLNSHPDLLKQLGKYKAGKGCLYINRLADVDQAVLKKLIMLSMEEIKKTVEKRKGEDKTKSGKKVK